MTTDSPDESSHLIPVAGKLRRSRLMWRILFFVALAAAVLAFAARYGIDQAATGGDRVARLVIDGTITTDRARLRAIEDLADNDKVKAVIVAINSPGGTTAGGEELYEALTALRAKKPVVAVIAELGASAAYMTAIATDRIFARRLSIVGSIGVLFQTVNAGKLFETIGIDLDKVATGPLKAEPDLDEAMSPEVRASLQSLVNDSFAWFVDVVAERRGLTREATLALSDGRILTGRQGIETKLIDEAGGELEAIAWLEANKQLAADLPVYTYYPLPEQGFGGWLKLLTGQAREAVGLSASGPIALDGLVSLWQAEPSM